VTDGFVAALLHAFERGSVGVEPLRTGRASPSPLQGGGVDPVGAALAPAQCDDLVGRASPVERLDVDLFPDDQGRERARGAILKHDEKGSVLLILPVRIDESLLDEAAQAHEFRGGALSPSGRASWPSARGHSVARLSRRSVPHPGPLPLCTTQRITWLARPREDLVSLGQPLAIRLEAGIVRNRDPHTLEPLKPVLEHWPVRLPQNIQPKIYHEIRADAEDVSIEGRVVKQAERYSVGHDRLASWIAVGQDVGRLEQLQVPEPANRASLLIRPQDPPGTSAGEAVAG
jgi:hypothetical protein